MRAASNHIIEVNRMVKKFGSFVANDHLSFHVEQGEIFGFLGANGAGKTTAMRIPVAFHIPPPGRLWWPVLMYIRTGSGSSEK